MARSFDSGVGEYLTRAREAGFEPSNLTLAFWFWMDTNAVGTAYAFAGKRDQTAGTLDWTCYKQSSAGATHFLKVLLITAGGVSAAEGPLYVGTSEWKHLCFNYNTTDGSEIWIDGVSEGVGAATGAITYNNQSGLHFAYDTFDYLDGRLAEMVMANRKPSLAEVKALASGYSPMMVFSGPDIVGYWPLIRDEDQDRVGGFDMTDVNTPTIAPHPPIIYPAPAFYSVQPAAGASASASPSATLSPSASASASESVSASVSASTSASASGSASGSPSPSPGPSGEVCWGHDTGVLEANIRNFQVNWAGTGAIENPGVADTERLALQAGEIMSSEMVDTGLNTVQLLQNEYAVGDDVTLRYRHGATPNACAVAGWNLYAAPFVSLGYVEVQVESTL